MAVFNMLKIPVIVPLLGVVDKRVMLPSVMV